MIISKQNYLEATEKIDACAGTTCYGPKYLTEMIVSADYILREIEKINNTVVVAKNHKEEDYDLKITIIDIKFFHNMLMIYAEHNVLKYIQEYIKTNIKEYNDMGYPDKINVRVTGNGWGNAIICHY